PVFIIVNWIQNRIGPKTMGARAATLNPPSLPELAYEHLRDSILDGTLEAGAPLRQEEIAARLGFSRLPIREALRRLDSEGLALLRPRRGYVVASLNRDEIDD